MSEIKCEVIRDLLPLVIDEAASEESKQLVMQHVENCEGCKGYYSGMTVGISRSAAVPESDKAFVRLGKRMKRKLSLKKLLVWMLVIFVVCVGAFFAWDQAQMWVDMDHSSFTAQLAYDYDGKVYVKIDNNGGPGSYHVLGTDRYDSILYITPKKPAFTLKKGTDHSIEFIYELRMTEDGLCVTYYDYHEYINEFGHVSTERREVVIPIKYVRFGTYDNYTTLYAPGDKLVSLEEIHNEAFTVGDEEYPLLAGKNKPEVQATPEPLPVEVEGKSGMIEEMSQPTPKPIPQPEMTETGAQPENSAEMPKVGDVTLSGQTADAPQDGAA